MYESNSLEVTNIKATTLRSQAKRMLEKHKPPRELVIVSGHLSVVADVISEAEAENPQALVVGVVRYCDQNGVCSTG